MTFATLRGKHRSHSRLVTELVQLKVDLLVLGAQPAIRAAKQATKTIPIVIVTTQNPVAAGFVDSLARPGGNITGVTRLTRELAGKRLELLKEVLPDTSRVGALVNETQTVNDFKPYEAPARALKIQLQLLKVREPNPDFEAALQAAAKWRATALITVSGSLFNRHIRRFADLAIRHRLPSMHERIRYVEEGGFMSYSANDAANYRRAATYVDKILKGRQACRSARGAADGFRFRDQSQNGKADRPDDSAECAGASGSGDSVERGWLDARGFLAVPGQIDDAFAEPDGELEVLEKIDS